MVPGRARMWARRNADPMAKWFDCEGGVRIVGESPRLQDG